MIKKRKYQLKALTDLWTGDYQGKPERTIPTGLLGSIRWWFEVLVRGLGGCACDPTDSHGRCPDKNGKRCVVCELFGCTGWARKFRFDVLDEGGQIKRDQIKKGETFRFRFTPLRSIRDEEWALLDLTLRLIADYGAIGGKTVLKPSEEPGREDLSHHKDYGIIEIEKSPEMERSSGEALRGYVRDPRWRHVEHGEFAWASLKCFWCVKDRYLARQNAAASTFNRVIRRNEAKQQGQQLRQGANDADRWLAGSRQESKKVFSFKDPPRTFGFVKPGLLRLDDMRKRLEKLKNSWSNFEVEEFVKGPRILKQLLSQLGGRAQ